MSAFPGRTPAFLCDPYRTKRPQAEGGRKTDALSGLSNNALDFVASNSPDPLSWPCPGFRRHVSPSKMAASPGRARSVLH
eukprot:3272660-Karenia_brevis.AAC.1